MHFKLPVLSFLMALSSTATFALDATTKKPAPIVHKHSTKAAKHSQTKKRHSSTAKKSSVSAKQSQASTQRPEALPQTDSTLPSLLRQIDELLPQKFVDKLPAIVRNELSTAGTDPSGDMCYWPGENETAHQLRLFTPPLSATEQHKEFPLIIYVHGGAWTGRPKTSPDWVGSFVKSGFAVAVVHYRLAQEGIFPAQMEDLNTCLRWLKANASKYKIDPNRIGLWGSSAGGHLVALMGTSWNSPVLDLGAGDKSISRQVQAVCDFCGPSNLVELGSQTAPGQLWDTVSPNSPLSKLLGGTAASQPARANAASPITYVSAICPPFLIMHGTSDQVIPVNQSEELAAALKAAGAPVTIELVQGAGHDIEKGENIEVARQFFTTHLRP